jgi:hypothetical protein
MSKTCTLYHKRKKEGREEEGKKDNIWTLKLLGVFFSLNSSPLKCSENRVFLSYKLRRCIKLESSNI